MKKVTKVTEIEIEVWTGIDLLIILNKIGQGESRFAKMATVQRWEGGRLWKSRCECGHFNTVKVLQ